MSCLCVIPARGGSKRIPRKNINSFHGRPMISWSIDAAIKANCFDRIVVSTDDEEIASIALSEGADVPFMRPAALADDYTGTARVVRHAINMLEQSGESFKAVCCLYATAPFVRREDILAGLRLWEHSPEGVTVFTASSFAFPIQRALTIDMEGRSHMLQADNYATRSQDLEEAFHDAGQFYWAASDGWDPSKNIYEGGVPLLLPRWRVQDIDTPEDWTRAEYMHQVLSDGLGNGY